MWLPVDDGAAMLTKPSCGLDPMHIALVAAIVTHPRSEQRIHRWILCTRNMQCYDGAQTTTGLVQGAPIAPQ